MVALALGFATAAITQAGLSLAAGAFLAGLIVSSSEYAHETLAHLLPLRDTFVALFFVTIGTLIRPSALIHHIGLVAIIVCTLIRPSALIHHIGLVAIIVLLVVLLEKRYSVMKKRYSLAKSNSPIHEVRSTSTISTGELLPRRRHCWSAQGSRTRRRSTAGPGKNQSVSRPRHAR
jgi:sodium/hydrogen exchanger family protein